MDKILEELPGKAAKVRKESLQYFKRLKKKTPKNLDYTVQDLHDAEFKKTDCLTCGNCCKTTSPMFSPKDITRIAKHLRMKDQKFISTYLERDEDDCYVLRTAPCTFFDETDNTCFIYEVRPNACSEYPHTNRKKFIQLGELTVTNTEICPAAYNIVEALKKKVPMIAKPQERFGKRNG
ncbi:YkgJ family cysteine cluster protein [Flavobacteriaceae bacterium]|nr:YkgJ family cysteine cluster protein [Flavobacteriaceae bacterium]